MFETETAGGYTAETAWNETGYPQGEDGSEAEDEWRRRRRYGRRRRRYYPEPDDDEAAFQGQSEDEDEGEEQFLPILAAGLKLLPTVLGALGGGGRREAEAEYDEYEDGEYPQGESEEQFILGGLLKKFLGEAPDGEGGAVLSPQQEAEMAGQLLEVDSEEELGRVLGGIVNAVGRAVQGVANAARTPQGQAVIDAVAPVVRAAMPGGGEPGEIFETETGGMSQEQEVFETARQAVRLIASTAHHAAMAPPGAPAELVGELGLIRAAGRLARPFLGRAVRGIFRPRIGIRVGFGRPGFRVGFRGGFRPGFRGGLRYGRPYRYRGRPYWGYRGPRYRGYGYAGPGYVEGPPPPAEPTGPPPPPEPPQPGYRWVAVPIGAPVPMVTPPEPAPADAAPGAADAPPPPGPAQGEWNEAPYGEAPYGEAPDGEAPYGEASYGEFQPGPGPGEWEAPMRNGNGDSGGRWVRRHGKIELLGA
jgi:hypothetical protein